MSDDKGAEPDKRDRARRQRLLDAALEAFPAELSPPFGESSPFYKELLDANPGEKLPGMLSWRIARVARAWRRFIDNELRRRGHSMTRWQVMFQLAVDRRAETLTTVAAQLGVMSAALVSLMDDLEREGLITRTTDEQDRRSKLIVLTPAGVQAVTEMFTFVAGLRRQFLAGVSESEMLLFLETLDVMSANLERLSGER